jgi:hypothetical protein
VQHVGLRQDVVDQRHGTGSRQGLVLLVLLAIVLLAIGPYVPERTGQSSMGVSSEQS